MNIFRQLDSCRNPLLLVILRNLTDVIDLAGIHAWLVSFPYERISYELKLTIW